MVAKKTPSPAFEFVVQYLEGKPEAAFREVDDAAQNAGLKLYPIVFGRAKAHLKLVPIAPRGEGKARRATAAMKSLPLEAAAEVTVSEDRAGVRAVATRRTARTPREKTVKISSSMSPMQSLEAVITKMREGELERERYRKALEQIGEIIQSVI